jgi:hypothetical protein
VSWETVRRRRKKFLAGTESIKDGRPVTVAGKANVSKVKEMIESNDKYLICYTAKAIGILLLQLHFKAYFESKIGFCQMDNAYICIDK